MPVSVPSYGGSYNQTEQNANATTICGYIDSNATADTTQKAAHLAWVQAAQAAILSCVESHGDGTNVGPLKAAFATYVTALGG